MAADAGDGFPRWSTILATSGCMIVRNPSALARTHPRRSTTTTGAVAVFARRPVKERTRPSERRAFSRSSVTTSRACRPETSGPGRTNRFAVATARSQSTISGGSWGSGRSDAGSLMFPTVRRAARLDSRAAASAAGGDLGGERVERGAGVEGVDQAHVVGDSGEHQRGVVAVDGDADQRVHVGQRAGLGPHQPAALVAEGDVAVGQAPVEPRDGQA